MKSSITIAVSSVCNNEILTYRLNKIQLHTVWCSINFYFCSKQTMNVFFHFTFAWICVDFSCKTAFVSYHVMSAKTRVLKCCCLLFDWTEFWESSTLLNHESWLAYDAFGSWFTSFSRVLPTSRVGYHAGKPMESVVYCLNIQGNSSTNGVVMWALYPGVFQSKCRSEKEPTGIFSLCISERYS